MKIKFKNDIKDLLPKGEKISLNSIKIPMNREVYFRSKQWELIEQYGGARRFLLEIYTDDWKHWFEKSKDPFDQDYFEWVHKSYFLEIAIMYYNIVVDLSWTLCYVVAEYAVKCNGKMVDFTGIMPIEEAYDLLRNAENNSKAPTSKDNPFEYLKKMNPEFSKAIDIIVDFWKSFSDCEIREFYNYCKHKGKPIYKEAESYMGKKKISITLDDPESENKLEIPNATSDVRISYSICDMVKKLKYFDEYCLYPYLLKLLNELECIIKPNPLVL